MKTELATLPQTQPRQSALAVMASRYSVEPNKLLDTLKGTVFKNATNEQLMALVVVSNEYDLNPFTRQIFAFPDKAGGIVPVVSVDGWLHMMQSQPQFDGIEYEQSYDDKGKLVSCTAIIHRRDRKFPTRITELLAECSRNTDPWNKSPSRMLRHRATIQCIRVAFGLAAADAEEIDVTHTGRVVDAPANVALFAPVEPVQGNESPKRANGLQGDPATDQGAAGEPDPVVSHETKPAEEKPKNGRIHAPPAEAPPITLSEAMESSDVSLADLNKVIQSSKLAAETFVTLGDIPTKLRSTLLNNWGDVLQNLGK